MEPAEIYRPHEVNLPSSRDVVGFAARKGPENPGSASHPKCQPCVFHYRNRCTSGDSCGFCHNPAHNGGRKLKGVRMCKRA